MTRYLRARSRFFPVLMAAGAAMLVSCNRTMDPADPGASGGTTDETSTVAFWLENGAPAARASVRIYAAADTTRVPVTALETDDQGALAMPRLPQGYYNLVVEGDSGRAVFQDSVLSTADTLQWEPDTLVMPGGIEGRVVVQPNHDPRIAWVALLGAGVFSNVDDSGRFSLPRIPEGRYTLLATTEREGYSPTWSIVEVRRGRLTRLGSIELVWTGLPLVAGIEGIWDSLGGTVRVSWSGVRSSRVAGWSVYRSATADPVDAIKVGWVGVGDTTWIDSLFQPFDSTVRKVRYWVRARSGDGDSGAVWRSWGATLRGPYDVGTWRPEWRSEAVPEGGSVWILHLDTLEGGVGAIVGSSSDRFRIGVQGFDGSIWKTLIPPMLDSPQATTDHGDYLLPGRSVGVKQGCFHRGRFWWVEFHKADGPMIRNDWGDSIEWADSVRIHSVGLDGRDLEESLPVRDGKATSAILVPQGDSLALLMLAWGKGTHNRPRDPIKARWIRTPGGVWGESDLAGNWVRPGKPFEDFDKGLDFDSRVQAGDLSLWLRGGELAFSSQRIDAQGAMVGSIPVATPYQTADHFFRGFSGLYGKWIDLRTRVIYPSWIDSTRSGQSWVWASASSLERPHRFIPPSGLSSYEVYGGARWRGRLWLFRGFPGALYSTPLP